MATTITKIDMDGDEKTYDTTVIQALAQFTDEQLRAEIDRRRSEYYLEERARWAREYKEQKAREYEAMTDEQKAYVESVKKAKKELNERSDARKAFYNEVVYNQTNGQTSLMTKLEYKGYMDKPTAQLRYKKRLAKYLRENGERYFADAQFEKWAIGAKWGVKNGVWDVEVMKKAFSPREMELFKTVAKAYGAFDN